GCVTVCLSGGEMQGRRRKGFLRFFNSPHFSPTPAPFSGESPPVAVACRAVRRKCGKPVLRRERTSKLPCIPLPATSCGPVRPSSNPQAPAPRRRRIGPSLLAEFSITPAFRHQHRRAEDRPRRFG